jgi:predicted glutamine amidotransferase
MCVIAVAPKDVAVPSDELMKKMFDHNSDGAGFAYTINNKVFVEKGFMSYKEFYNALAGLDKKLKNKNLTTTDIPIMFHFRIGTHGPNSRGLTHPFPFTDNTKYFEALDYKTNVVLAHNGIINTVKPVGGLSDTVQYIKDIVLPLYHHDQYFYDDIHLQELLANTNDSSRFAILDDRGTFTFIGTWHDDEEAPGVKFSNLLHSYSYKYTPTTYSTSYAYDTFLRNMKPLNNTSAKFFRGTSSLTHNKKGKKGRKEIEAIPVTNESIQYYVDDYGFVYHDTTRDPGLAVPVVYYDTAYVQNKDLSYTKITAKSHALKDVEYVQLDVDDYLDSIDYAGGWNYN